MGSTTRSQVCRLFLKLCLLGLPLLALLAVIAVCDPFRVIYRHDFGNYFDEQPYELNHDYVSTEMLLHRYKQAAYDTFILGSSTSFPFHCDELQKHLPGARPFHYPAANENLYGIYCKVKFLDRLGLPLKHLLIVFDPSKLGDVTSRQDHLHILHPEVSGESWANFEVVYLQTCFTSVFIVKYIDYRLSGKIRPYMHGIFDIPPGKVRIDPACNDYFFEAEERLLQSDSAEFYRRRKELFAVTRPPTKPIREPVIGDLQRKYLEEMAAIFARHGTDCRIVIPPAYDQVALNPQDREALETIFGKERVCDCTGVNGFTDNIRNFYDRGHCRPFVANQILQAVYKDKKSGDPAAIPGN
jgi:hypothetical protein